MLSFKQFIGEAKKPILDHQQSPEDISDAKEVSHGLSTYGPLRIHSHDKIDAQIDSFQKPHKTEKIPLDKVKITADHGRRINDTKLLNKPIIAMKLHDGTYHTLDGQHRVLTHREAGHTHVHASIVSPKWIKGAGIRGKSSHFTNGDLENT